MTSEGEAEVPAQPELWTRGGLDSWLSPVLSARTGSELQLQVGDGPIQQAGRCDALLPKLRTSWVGH